MADTGRARWQGMLSAGAYGCVCCLQMPLTVPSCSHACEQASTPQSLSTPGKPRFATALPGYTHQHHGPHAATPASTLPACFRAALSHPTALPQEQKPPAPPPPQQQQRRPQGLIRSQSACPPPPPACPPGWACRCRHANTPRYAAASTPAPQLHGPTQPLPLMLRPPHAASQEHRCTACAAAAHS